MNDWAEAKGRQVFGRAGFLCCTEEQFLWWWEKAMMVPGPKSARVFCADCPANGRQLMASMGLCVREKQEMAA